jgi:hypothetical protein
MGMARPNPAGAPTRARQILRNFPASVGVSAVRRRIGPRAVMKIAT